METRRRKRAEASSSAPSSQAPTTRASKRSRTSAASASTLSNPTALPPAASTRSRRNQNPPSSSVAAAAPAPMDSSASDTAARRRSSSGKNHQPPAERDRESSDKGKEREPEASRSRDRDRDAERILGMSFDGGGADDDNDSEGGVGILHQNLTSASSALQGLLRKLGAGLDDLLPSSAGSASSSSHQSGRLKKILSGLRADGEEGRQVEALTQLCDMLSIGTEDSLGSFSVDSFVPVLVGLLNHESNPDIMLLAARALTHLCDVLPSSCSAVVHYGAVPCFCARLLTIEYMDLAEQSLQALKKISQEHPTACLRAGALMAVLSYLDFFSTGVQRVALSTASNMCKKLPSDAADFVMEAVPLLTNLLSHHDSKVLEHASVCLTRIAEAFASSPEKLDELCNHGLVEQAAGLISVSNSGGQASLSTSTYTGLIRLLSTCASGSPLGAKTLLLLGISGTLKDVLSSSGLVAGVSVSPALTRPAEQIYEIVNLADELLPPLPQGTISLPICYNVLVKGSAAKKSPASSSHNKQEETDGAKNEVSSREKLLHDQPELLQQFGKDLLPVLTQVYSSSVNGQVRHKCLSVIGKLMYFSSADMIQALLSLTNISSFLAGILAWKDPQILIPALQIAEILMDKLPGTFTKMFVREGVVHAVDALICSGSSDTVPSQTSISEKDTDSLPGMSSRSRRYRRRNSSLSTESSSFDESKGYVPGHIGSPPTLVEVPTANSSLRASVSSYAKSFKDKYFPADPGAAEVGVSDDLLHLKNLCSKLNASIENVRTKAKGKSKASVVCSFDISASTEEQLDGVIAEMLAELTKGDGVSTFEFIGSGVVLALLNYLSCGTFGKERISEPNVPKLRQQALRRYKSFISIALPLDIKEGTETPMTVLVQKLQHALSSLERFPVVLSHSSRSSSSGSARLSSGLSALSQPLKLRLCRAQGEKSLRDYSSNIVLIDPLARLASVEEFLWPRVQRSESGQKSSVAAGNSDSGVAATAASSPSMPTPTGRRPSTRSRSLVTIGGTARKDSHEGSANSSKGKGKAVLKSTADEARGPQTRNAARRRAGSEKDSETKPAHGESSSEDEELDMSPVEIDDALMIEEDDFSDDEDDDHDQVLRDDSLPGCVPDKVHDVKLGDPADDATVSSSASDNQAQPSSGSSNRTTSVRGPGSAEYRTGSTFGSRGSAMSFATAAMAGLASVSGRGIRGGRDRHGLVSGDSVKDHYNKLMFTAGGKQLSKHLTIYQAIQRQLVLEEDNDERFNGSDLPSDGGRFWSDIFTITYQKADSQVERASHGGSTSKSKSVSSSKSGCDSQWQQMSLLDSILQGELPCDLEKSNPTYNILALLRVLEGLNQLAPRLRVQTVSEDFAEGKISSLDELYRAGAKVPSEEFISSKLTPKLARQIQDPLALCSGSLPSWCYQMTKASPFLFPFETRRLYFYSTAFGLSRALHRLQQQQSADSHSSSSEREVRVGRLQRQKVRVARNRILDSALKVMDLYCSTKAVLEVEYFGEVGTGLGPTLEFYTLLSQDLQKVGLGLWRSSSTSDNSAMDIDGVEMKDGNTDDGSEAKKLSSDFSVGSRDLIHAPFGLFPRPWPPNTDASDGSQFSKVVEYFRLVGRVMAKALQDGRLLDLPLSTAFYKLMLGQELDVHDIISFDAEFGKILQEMKILVHRKQFLEATAGNDQKTISDLRIRGAPVEDLCLDFTLPGYPDYILKGGGEGILVNIDNLEEYISLVVDATVKTGIMRQMEAFRSGFNQVFDISSLQIFSPPELDYLICGRRELWVAETLAEHIKFDHGYTAKSPAIINLLEIMAEFTTGQQHAFCQFVTGAPRFPPGGLAALNPKLTIVRKHSSTTTNTSSNGTGVCESADDDLPSVMTCANYLKLPPYSTKEIMYKKLLYAISEGQGSFDLS
ncbi:E3 ubiquitin-protein ligase UPL3-like [Phoenix dactylifera]|uniref:HECT-type E3 ubiquitin transferase n=1 Tax=Phoenix dactylifera TaxID=42345 RepID=A0A8B8J3Y3_PHODC|nr:E3 ubiquitin-protein ligase UPL3-like [Phoenix dactylifera]